MSWYESQMCKKYHKTVNPFSAPILPQSQKHDLLSFWIYLSFHKGYSQVPRVLYNAELWRGCPLWSEVSISHTSPEISSPHLIPRR